MRILEIIPNLNSGGAERFVVDLVNEFSRLGHEVFLITSYNTGKNDLFLNLVSPNVKYITLGKSSGFDYKLSYKLYKVIHEIKPDIVHSHIRVLNYVLPICFLKYKFKLHFVHTIHNDAIKECPNKMLFKIRKFTYKLKKITPVTISKESHDSFEKYYSSNISAYKIDNGRSIPQKSDKYKDVLDFKEELYDSYGNDLKIFVNVGRIMSQKNHTMLVKAFKSLIEQGNNIILFIIGAHHVGEIESDTIIKNITPNLSERIRLLGTRSNVEDYLFIADFFCLSSFYEGLPISLLEAMACKAIPISTPVGGIKEVILEDGILSNSIEKSDYEDALKKGIMMSTEEKEIKLKNLYNRFMSNYSINACANKYITLFEKKKMNK
ncbi:glycosyltransferase [Aquimarina muelleri]|uniref:glycosyltransferase n=1 Tax=Aquimarina muelleri TaxID=279356 RepID=UPI003F682522